MNRVNRMNKVSKLSKFKKHRFIRFCAALCMMCALLVPMLCMPVGAAGGAAITVDAVTAQQGGTVKVTLSLNDNPGLWGLRFRVGYNHDALTLKSVEAGTVFSSAEITAPPSLDQKEYIFVADRSDFTNTTANGVLATLTFEVKGDAKPKNYPITVKLEDTINAEGTTIELNSVNGSVSVSVPEPETTTPSTTASSGTASSGEENGGTTTGATTQNPGSGNRPQTGDSTRIMIFLVLGIAAIGSMGVVAVWKKRKA